MEIQKSDSSLIFKIHNISIQVHNKVAVSPSNPFTNF